MSKRSRSVPPARGRLPWAGWSGLLQGLVFCAFAYGLPLLSRPRFLADPRILFLAAGSILLLVAQPPARFRDSLRRGARDRGSLVFILAAAAVGQLAIVVDWAYRQAPRPAAVDLPWVVAGGLLVVGGVVLRFWSMVVLGRWFTSVVRVRREQEVVQHGPYAVVRHPSYAGVLLATAGGALLLHSLLGLAVAVALLGAAYAYRVRVEEVSLEGELGDAYAAYRDRVRWRLVPFVW